MENNSVILIFGILAAALIIVGVITASLVFSVNDKVTLIGNKDSNILTLQTTVGDLNNQYITLQNTYNTTAASLSSTQGTLTSTQASLATVQSQNAIYLSQLNDMNLRDFNLIRDINKAQYDYNTLFVNNSDMNAHGRRLYIALNNCYLAIKNDIDANVLNSISDANRLAVLNICNTVIDTNRGDYNYLA